MTVNISFNEVNALSVLQGDSIETRLCVAIQPEDTVYYFVHDSSSFTANGNVYEPVPYAEFSEITSGDGQTADTMEIVLDGENMISNDDEWTVDQIFQDILSYPLRDRPICVALAVLNVDTHVVEGIIPQFIGFVDHTPLERPRGEPSRLTIRCSSYRAFAARRIARVHSNSDHQSRFPGDESAQWISSIVFRSGKFPWNKATGVSAGSVGSGGGRRQTDGGAANLQRY